MNKFALILAAAAVLLSAPAVAADMAVPPPLEKAAFHPVRVYEWTGFYIGVNGGYATGQSRANFPALGDSADFTLDGALVGGTVGFNLQAGPIVWGVEGDIGIADISGGAGCPAPGITCSVRNRWLGTARGRLGWAIHNWMPYITGGMAFGEVQVSALPTGAQSTTHGGWTAGGGVEVALSRKWSMKAEYLFVQLDNFSCEAPTCFALGPVSAPFREHLFRGGINYAFN
jgi:outer membrane immunogenic protein